MKKLALRALYPLLRLFYKKEWLTGKWFTRYKAGYLWALRSLPRRLFKRQPWPISRHCQVQNPKNLRIDPSSLNCLQNRGCYFQNQRAAITIGKDVYIANNVGLITQNHNPLDLDEHLPGEDIVIGDRCWIGMNCVILPGVTLGPGTVVGAGAVVTKSFPEGQCVIAGNPARLLRRLDEPASGER